jgi:hypothetical protein
MGNAMQRSDLSKELRRTPRLKVTIPFPCAFSRLGLARWQAGDKGGYGVVFDLSLRGARVMSPISVRPGDELAVSLRLPNQPVAMNVNATVRWHSEHVFGVEFGMVSHVAETRLRKYLAKVDDPLASSDRS